MRSFLGFLLGGGLEDYSWCVVYDIAKKKLRSEIVKENLREYLHH